MGLFRKNRQSEQGFIFHPMEKHHVPPALDIIFNHDEDDSAEAEMSFAEDLSRFYVVEIDGQLAGVTGYSRIIEAPTSAWLSWTYVDTHFQRQGVGSYLVAELSTLLKKRGVERLFIATSDYKEDGIDIYAGARRFYERLGARCDLKIPNFYQMDESKYIYRLIIGEQTSKYFDRATTDKSVHFVDTDILEETQTAYRLLWEERKKHSSQLEDQQNNDDIASIMKHGIENGAHAFFASLPAPLSREAAITLQRAGFRQLGNVIDYYGPGHDDVYWSYYPDISS